MYSIMLHYYLRVKFSAINILPRTRGCSPVLSLVSHIYIHFICMNTKDCYCIATTVRPVFTVLVPRPCVRGVGGAYHIIVLGKIIFTKKYMKYCWSIGHDFKG